MGKANTRSVRQQLLTLAFATLVAVWTQSALAAKNVIIMISDGAGFNTWIATSMYMNKLGKQVYDQEEWTHIASRTHPLNRSESPTGNDVQDGAVVYDPAKAWANTRAQGKEFDAYTYLKNTYTDSAAAATAMATGQKTYNNSINWTNTNQPMKGQTIAEIAKAQGKAVGVVTSVEWSHATPAGFGGAHNVTRNDYVGIANEMLNAAYLDVIMGAGHPEYNDNGERRSDVDAQYVGGAEVWEQLKKGTHANGWKLVQTKPDFEALASGPTPAKVVATAQVATTLQQKRSRPAPKGSKSKSGAERVFEQPLNDNVPSLETMAKGALNCLDDNPQGFFLMIEGGAVDWANHANQGNRMIEEQIGFLRAVEAVIHWVSTNSSWDDTLLILTADHECGLLWGANSDDVAFDPVVSRGLRKQPALKYQSGSHTNSLVPLYARGSGSKLFGDKVVGTDKTAAEKWAFSGEFVDNTSIFGVMQIAITAKAPEPAEAAAR